MSGGFSDRVKDIVFDRANGACERCGRVSGRLEYHHRQFRSRGGAHTVENCVLLCGFGNAAGCHGWAHSSVEAVSDGFSIGRGVEKVSLIPIRVARFGVLVCFVGDMVLRAVDRCCFAHLGCDVVPPGCPFCRVAGGVLWQPVL